MSDILISIDIGYKNLAWVAFALQPLRYLDAGDDTILSTKRKKPTTEQVVLALTDWIRTGPLTRYPNATILCETQVGQAIKNRIMSYVLQSHWYPRPFHFMSSLQKFRLLPNKYYPSTVDKTTICSAAYGKRKRASVLLTMHIAELCDMPEARQTIQGLTKKDDMGDAFVQGIAFIHKGQ
jgi:hypothetical protein